jgi:hypothetical protein
MMSHEQVRAESSAPCIIFVKPSIELTPVAATHQGCGGSENRIVYWLEILTRIGSGEGTMNGPNPRKGLANRPQTGFSTTGRNHHFQTSFAQICYLSD